MNALTTLKRLAQALLFGSIISTTTTPLLHLLGITPPTAMTTAMELLHYGVLASGLLLGIMSVLILGLGYLTLTGWRTMPPLPRLVKLGFAAALGLLALLLSRPLAIVLPLPVVPTLISALGLWILLRVLSNHVTLHPPHPVASISLDTAILQARRYLSTLEPLASEVELRAATKESNDWQIALQAPASANTYHVTIHPETGEVIQWHQE
jgi:hypothetical protein